MLYSARLCSGVLSVRPSVYLSVCDVDHIISKRQYGFLVFISQKPSRPRRLYRGKLVDLSNLPEPQHAKWAFLVYRR